MNKELITKLKETAWLDAVAMSYTEEHKCRISSDYFRMLEQNRFAELIVRECANWIESQDEAEHPTAWLLCDELKQHFGVKE